MSTRGRLLGTVQEEATDNTTYPEIAAGIVAARSAKKESPGFQLRGDKVLATLVDVRDFSQGSSEAVEYYSDATLCYATFQPCYRQASP